MMAGIPVLLAGRLSGDLRGERAAEWSSRLEDAGLSALFLWCPPDEGEPTEQEKSFAASLGASLSVDPEPPSGAEAILSWLRGNSRRRLLEVAAARSLPILVDRPASVPMRELRGQLHGAPGARVLSGYHLSSHPSFTRAERAVRDGETGLLRAVMIDLVVAGSPYTDDDQRALIADPIDLFTRLTGPTAMTVATASLSAAHTTFTAQTARDIVLSAHVSRVPAMNEETLLARARFVGSHGHIDIDLCAPALTVRNPGMTSTHPYGADPITARLRELAAMVKSGTRGHTPASWLEVSRIVDAVIESAATGVAVTIPEEI